MKDMQVQQRIRQFLVDNRRYYGFPETLTSDYRLIDKGVLDSMGMFEVISCLENQYGIQIEDQDIVPENFESLNAIARLVAAKGGG